METLAYIEIIDIDWGFLIEVLLFINFETNNQPNRMRLNGGPADIHSVDWYFTLFYILLGINGNIGRTQKEVLLLLNVETNKHSDRMRLNDFPAHFVYIDWYITLFHFSLESISNTEIINDLCSFWI